MSATERDFNNFLLDDNVLELADGLLPEVAADLGVNLGAEPNSEALGQLVGKIGANKVLRENDNTEVQAIPFPKATYYVCKSAVQEPLARSLWTPEVAQPDTVDATVISGGVANWMSRTEALLLARARDNKDPGTIFIPIGNRQMGSGTEVSNPRVALFTERYHRPPTEAEFAEEFTARAFEAAGLPVVLLPFATAKGNEVASSFVTVQPELFSEGKTVSFARVANAGIQLAVEFRKAAQAVKPGFDTDPSDPQVFVLTDTFPIATTAAGLADAARFQSPYTGLRQVALSAKMLHEAAGGQ